MARAAAANRRRAPVVGELIPAGARGRQQRPAAVAPRARRRCATASSIEPAFATGTGPSNAARLVGRLADRDDAREPMRRGAQRREVQALRAAAGDQRRRRPRRRSPRAPRGRSSPSSCRRTARRRRARRPRRDAVPARTRARPAAIAPGSTPKASAAAAAAAASARRPARSSSTERTEIGVQPRRELVGRRRSPPRRRRAPRGGTTRRDTGAAARRGGRVGSSRLPTCTSSPPWFAKIRAFAAAYAVERAVPVEVVGREVQQHGDPRVEGLCSPAGTRTPPRRARRASRAPPRERPAVVAARDRVQAARPAGTPRASRWSSSSRSSPSPRGTGARPAARRAPARPRPAGPARGAHRRTSVAGGTPGLVTTSVTPSRSLGSWPPARTSTPRRQLARRPASSAARASVTRTARPRPRAPGRGRARRPGADHDGALPANAPVIRAPPRARKSA